MLESYTLDNLNHLISSYVHNNKADQGIKFVTIVNYLLNVCKSS